MAGSRVAKGTVSDKTGLSTTLTLSSVSVDGGATLIVMLVFDYTVAGLNDISWNGVAMTPRVNIGGAFADTSVWYIHNATAATGDIVATFDVPPSAMAMAASMWYGLTSSPNDKIKSATGTSTSPSSTNTTTTAQAAEVLIGCVGTVGPAEDTAGSWSGSFAAGQRVGTTGGAAASNTTLEEGYRIVSATGAYAAAKTGITSREWMAVIATFRLVTDVSVALGHASATATASALTLTPGDVSVALGHAQANAVAEPLALALSDQPLLIIRDPDATFFSSVRDSSTLESDPWTGDPLSVPTTVYLRSGTNAGVRAATPYYALVQNHDLGFGVGLPSAYSSVGGVAQFVGIGGFHGWELIFSVDAAPIQRESPDEPHWLMSYFASNGSESEDLLCMGVTPNGRVILRVRSRLDTMSPINTIVPNTGFHSLMMEYDWPSTEFVVYLDGVQLLYANYGGANSGSGLAYNDFPGPREGWLSRFMLLNGRLGDTNCDCRISRAAVYPSSGPTPRWYWDIPSEQPFTTVPAVQTTDTGLNLDLDVQYWNPSPDPLLYGAIPTLPAQYATVSGNYTGFITRLPSSPSYTKLPNPVP